MKPKEEEYNLLILEVELNKIYLARKGEGRKHLTPCPKQKEIATEDRVEEKTVCREGAGNCLRPKILHLYKVEVSY